MSEDNNLLRIKDLNPKVNVNSVKADMNDEEDTRYIKVPIYAAFENLSEKIEGKQM